MIRVGVSIVLVMSATLLCLAGFAVTNTVSSAVFLTAATNAPAAKVSRQQCEAITKSGNRCKRNAILGEKLCRQHLKVANRTLVGSGAAR